MIIQLCTTVLQNFIIQFNYIILYFLQDLKTFGYKIAYLPWRQLNSCGGMAKVDLMNNQEFPEMKL